MQSIRDIEARYKEKLSEDLSLGKSMSFGRNVNGSGKYAWFPFRQALPPKILDTIFCYPEMDKSRAILDPFMGSGNVLLASVERGLAAYGVDISPLFQFISHVKTMEISEQTFNRARAIILKAESLPFEYSKIPSLSSFDKLFKKDTLAHLLNVLDVAHNTGEVENIVKFVVVATLLQYSRAARWGKGLRVVRNKPRYRGERLIKKLKQMKEDQNEFKNKQTLGHAFSLCGNVKNGLGDLRDIKGKKILLSKKNEIDTVITSPPYCNSSDYVEMYKLEHWLLGYISNKEEFSSLSRSTVRSHTSFANEKIKWKHEVTENIASSLEDMDLWSSKIPSMIRGYTSDLYTVLRNVVDILKDEARLFIVEGNSCYGGIPIPFDLILADAAAELDLNVKKIITARYLITSSQQRPLKKNERKILRESIITMSAD